MATSTDSSLARSEYEISTFAAHFLEQVTSWMDQASAKFFLAKMNDSIEALYKERNAISPYSSKK